MCIFWLTFKTKFLIFFLPASNLVNKYLVFYSK